MAAHVRTQIRDAVIVLLTGLATTGSNVFKNRTVPTRENKLPALIVRTGDENDDVAAIDYPQLYDRTLELEVEILAIEESDIDAELNQILKEVESALSADINAYILSGLAKSVSLTRIETDYSDEGEKRVGSLKVYFDVNYFTQANAPDLSV